MRRVMAATTLIVLMLTTGCGSIIHGSEQRITFSSNPPGAQVLYDGGVRGITPCQVSLQRRSLKNLIVIQKEGFIEKQIEVKTGVSMWALLGNFVIGGIPGWIIDAATGSFGQMYTEAFTVDLVPDKSAVAHKNFSDSP